MSKNLLTERSLQQACWHLAEFDLDQVDLLMRRHDVPEIVAQILNARGIAPEGVQSFLNPTLKADFPDPFSLKGMGDMAEEVARAIGEKKNFAIFGDFDVDGATSSSVLYRFLKACGIEAPVYIPDRLTEGYGPNIDALRKIREQGTDILMMLDCGTTAFDVIAAGAEMGLQIVILDHHEAEDQLPAAWHVINPKRKDDVSGLSMLAAVGVTFLACVAINSRLRAQGFYENAARPEPEIKSLLDLVALGTVCDMVPLKGANRLFVRLGLQAVRNIGMLALMQTAKIAAPLSTFDCGFILGPRINAGSRIDKPDMGANLLCSDDAEDCKNLAWTLHDCNEKRKDIQKEMEEQAIAQVQQKGLDQHALIFVGDQQWHPGLSGLVAGRLKERFKKPACVVTYAENAAGVLEARGSGRSVPGVHIGQAFIDARHLGLVEKGGGHAMAGGFTALPEKIEALNAFLIENIRHQLGNQEANIKLVADGILTTRAVQVDLVEMLLRQLGPFGQEFAEPVFILRNVRVHSADILGTNHVRVMLSDWEGGARIKAMAFKAADTTLGEALLNGKGSGFDVYGTLKVNDWQGRKTAEMHIVDANPVHADAARGVAAK